MSAFNTLSKMLNLERENNFEDKAVIGGLQKFVPSWRQEAAQEGCDSQLIDEIASLMEKYSLADERKARIIVIEKIATLLSSQSSHVSSLPHSVGPEGTRLAETAAQAQDATETQTTKEATSPPVSQTQSAPRGEARSVLSGLKAPVTALPRISVGYAKKLERLGVNTVQDLLYLFPRRYNDFTNLKKINQLSPGEEVTIIGMIWDIRERQTARGLNIVSAIVTDGTGTIEATWFNQHYLKRRLQLNRQVVLSGKIDLYLGRLVIQSPEWEPLEKELIHTGRLVPVYPLTEGLSDKWMRTLIHKTVEYWAKRLPEHLTEDVLKRTGLMPLGEAIAQIHFPENEERAKEAKHRLAFDEFLLIQL